MLSIHYCRKFQICQFVKKSRISWESYWVHLVLNSAENMFSLRLILSLALLCQYKSQSTFRPCREKELGHLSPNDNKSFIESKFTSRGLSDLMSTMPPIISRNISIWYRDKRAVNILEVGCGESWVMSRVFLILPWILKKFSGLRKWSRFDGITSTSPACRQHLSEQRRIWSCSSFSWKRNGD